SLRERPGSITRQRFEDFGVVMMILAVSMRFQRAMCVAAAFVLFAPVAGARAEGRSPIVDVPSSSAEMAAAIARARATLGVFRVSWEDPKPSETGHSLKVRFPTPRNGGEHIWIAEVKRLADGRYAGRFANTPRDIPGKKAGDLVEFKEADISDWMF